MDFYTAFENRFRGDDVKEKLKIYLPLLKDKDKKAIDIGCGRGEFLEILKENGFNNLVGVDINEKIVNKKFNIVIEDGIEFLKKEPSNSAGIISAFHMIEHIPFEKVKELIKEAFRVLDKNGILIFETPNPENIKVISENFWLDYTHIRPIPMELLKFSVEFYGFSARILRLNEKNLGNSIKDVIENVSPDYAVIGFKNSSMINEDFFNRGVSLDLAEFAFEERIKNLEERMNNLEIEKILTENYHLKETNKNLNYENNQLKNHIQHLENENNQLKNHIQHLENENNQLKNHIQHLENENNNLKNHINFLEENLKHIQVLYNDVLDSKSWKITKPLREFTNFLRRKKRKAVLQITTQDKDIELSNRAKEIYEKLKKETDDNN